MKCIWWRAAGLLFAGVVLCAPAAAARLVVNLDKNWRFSENAGEASWSRTDFDDAAWKDVDLPYTWNRVGRPANGAPSLEDTYSGAAWYRLAFRAPRAADASRYVLQFDGASRIADVWLNGRFLGRHEGSFARFRLDATKAIRPGVRNVLAVRVDNSLPAPGSPTADIIPLSGDFFVYGGLYRKVKLLVVPEVHIDLMDFGGPGLYAHATSIGTGTAAISVETRIANDAADPRNASLELRILDKDGNAVAHASRAVALGAHAVDPVTAALAIAEPHLWDGMRDPYLYRIVATLRDGHGAVMDEVGQPLGLRTIAFDADKGFFLNGKHLFLKGVGLHQDVAGKGWAETCADQKRDLDIAEDVGANALRLAHYQHAQCSYNETDRRGMIVWAELPLVNQVSFDGTPASAGLAANARQQLVELIRQNYNHPSIAMWSVGNEIDLRATQTNGPSRAASLVRALVALAKREDPSRSTALADCCEQAKAADRDALVGLTDLVGYNRYFGWYYGKTADFGTMLDKAHSEHPALPIGISEFGAGAALSQHSDDPEGGPINPHGRPHPEEVQDLYHEESWKEIAARPYLWGAFIWNLTDFPSAGREEGDLIDMNDKGLVSYDRQVRKDAYYFYRANWNAAPTLHLVGSRYTDRPYAVVDVKAYANAQEASLSRNGTPVGTVPCAGGICVWKMVHLQTGTNVLKAEAAIGGVTLEDSMTWTFAGSPSVVNIKAGDVTGIVAKDGTRFGSDLYFAGGTGMGINPPDTPDKDRIAVSAGDPSLFDSYRTGRFSYRIPLPDGRFTVELRFVEPSATAPGQRLFDVAANGAIVLRGFDVFARAGGKLRGITQSFAATVKDGILTLDFLPRRGDALVSAISIRPS